MLKQVEKAARTEKERSVLVKVPSRIEDHLHQRCNQCNQKQFTDIYCRSVLVPDLRAIQTKIVECSTIPRQHLGDRPRAK